VLRASPALSRARARAAPLSARWEDGRACRYDFIGSFVTGSMFRLCASFVTQSEKETTTAADSTARRQIACGWAAVPLRDAACVRARQAAAGERVRGRSGAARVLVGRALTVGDDGQDDAGDEAGTLARAQAGFRAR
jgi:hypothetical protein